MLMLIQDFNDSLGPTPLLTTSFVILREIIKRLGPQYSHLTPKSCDYNTIVFVTCDVTALVIQAIGGGMASTADNQKATKLDGHVALAGIAFQLTAIVTYIALALDFSVRYWLIEPIRGRVPIEQPEQWSSAGNLDSRLRLMISGLVFMVTCVFIRSVYPVVELSDGWNGRVISTQVYFNVLDGGMITLASYTLNIFHPGFLLRAPERSGHPSDTTSPLEAWQDGTPKVSA
ncbi:hypothetical protein EW146_g4582 [Bondarzewia mesenterica]|uniref:RTA1 like protein n=1 Tax=Bondarzewia mesenterica TaxID=1095465 RepID=A0A4S4LV66_9AGAM|nr:hypothetical protein EW146_g4582 [Bondarzewia mesenterica]